MPGRNARADNFHRRHARHSAMTKTDFLDLPPVSTARGTLRLPGSKSISNRVLLLGASRKRFLGALLADADGEPRPVERRDQATDAVSAIAAAMGVWAVRKPIS